MHADNIYMKGGANMAEVLQNKQTNASTTGSSIAMRMKKNREAAAG